MINCVRDMGHIGGCTDVSQHGPRVAPFRRESRWSTSIHRPGCNNISITNWVNICNSPCWSKSVMSFKFQLQIFKANVESLRISS